MYLFKYKMTTICVPSECTLHEAIRRSNQCDTQTTILLKKGEYDIKARRSLICIQKYLIITKPVCILGDNSILNGGLFIPEQIQGAIHIENIHIRHKLGSGIIARSSFTAKNISIRACLDDGILIHGSSVTSTCTNLKIQNCLESGLTLEGGATTHLNGLNTIIQHNTCGISVCHSALSVVKIEYPITKETISKHNIYNLKAIGCASLSQIQNI